MSSQNKFSGLFPLLSAFTLMSCGGTSTSSEAIVNHPSNVTDSLLALERDLGRQVISEPFSAPSAAFVVGSATYDGVISGMLSGEEMQPINLIGELTIETNFANGPQAITGNAQNFVTHDGERLSGQLELRDGFLEVSGDPNVDHTVSASLDGSIAFEETDKLNISLSLEGDFYGAEVLLIAGGANGIAQRNTASLAFDGRFVAASSTAQ